MNSLILWPYLLRYLWLCSCLFLISGSAQQAVLSEPLVLRSPPTVFESFDQTLSQISPILNADILQALQQHAEELKDVYARLEEQNTEYVQSITELHQTIERQAQALEETRTSAQADLEAIAQLRAQNTVLSQELEEVGVQADSLREERNVLRQRSDTLSREQNDLREEVRQLNQELSSTAYERDTAQGNLADTSDLLETIYQRLTDTQSENKRLKETLLTSEQSLAQANAELARQPAYELQVSLASLECEVSALSDKLTLTSEELQRLNEVYGDTSTRLEARQLQLQEVKEQLQESGSDVSVPLESPNADVAFAAEADASSERELRPSPSQSGPAQTAQIVTPPQDTSLNTNVDTGVSPNTNASPNTDINTDASVSTDNTTTTPQAVEVLPQPLDPAAAVQDVPFTPEETESSTVSIIPLPRIMVSVQATSNPAADVVFTDPVPPEAAPLTPSLPQERPATADVPLNTATQDAKRAYATYVNALKTTGGTTLQQAQEDLAQAQGRLATLTGGRTYLVKQDDTLSAIAVQLYGSGSQYHKIAYANAHLLTSPNQLLPGVTLVIP